MESSEQTNIPQKINNKEIVTLYEAILLLESVEECEAFFNDLCTPSENRSLGERWLVAQLLAEKKFAYRKIHEETKVSVATITRVARFLSHEKNGGYRSMMEKIKEQFAKKNDN